MSSLVHSSTRLILDRILKGENQAFDDLFSRVAHRLLQFAARECGGRVKSRFDPQEIAQEAYLEAFLKFDRFEYRGPGSFLAWVGAIAKLKIRNFDQRYAVQKRAGDVPLEVEPAHEGPSPVDLAIAWEVYEEFTRCTAQLSERERYVVEARQLEGVPTTEIAERIDSTPENVHVIFSRAMKKLRRLFGEQA
ncbi:MAG: RNA polymerase sigma factor [Planctomycetota bacterium]